MDGCELITVFLQFHDEILIKRVVLNESLALLFFVILKEKEVAMKTEELYKRLLDRQDMQDIPIITIIKVCIATVEELNNCLEVEKYDESIS